jgi:outer membrane immunogenic protein
MRTVIQFIILLGLASALGPLTSTFVTAQEGSGPEVGINYQYVHTNAPPGGCGCFSMNGGSAWFAYKWDRSLAAVAELSTERSSNVDGLGDDLTITSYLFGPRYSLREGGRFVPFGQFLLGGAHASGSFAPGNGGYPGSSNAFAFAAGAGLNISLSRRFSVRAFQADYYLTHFSNGVNDHQNNLRIGAGLVIRLSKG